MGLISFYAYGKDKNEYFSLIGKAWQDKNYQAGYEGMKEAVVVFPEIVDFWYSLSYFAWHLKKYQEAQMAGKRAYEINPVHEHAINSYKNALMNRGWEKAEEKKFEEAASIFKTAFKTAPEDEWVINGYGYALRMLKQYKSAVKILAQGLDKYPKQEYIRGNLAWTYYETGEVFFQKKQLENAYYFYKKGYETYHHKDSAMLIAYLYKLPHLEKFEEGLAFIKNALNLFPEEKEKLFEPIYWLYHNYGFFLKKTGKIEEMMDVFQKNYQFSSENDRVWAEGRTFSHLAMSNFYYSLMGALDEICYYYQKFDDKERKVAFNYLKHFEKAVLSDLSFVYLMFAGSAYYRDNQIGKARKYLEEAYGAFLSSREGKKYKIETIRMPFPLKGFYYAGGNKSKAAITHMGLSQYCYDITGADLKGSTLKPGSSGQKVEDFLGFGEKIYAPVSGEVLAVEDSYEDDPVSNTPNSPKGNSLQILSGDKIFTFVHIKKGSAHVKKGDKVEAGMIIAELGNSSSSIPHLHFGVYSKDWLISYPVNFTNYKVIKAGDGVPVEGRPGGDGGSDLIETVNQK